jgi:hypothetical protein
VIHLWSTLSLSAPHAHFIKFIYLQVHSHHFSDLTVNAIWSQCLHLCGRHAFHFNPFLNAVSALPLWIFVREWFMWVIMLISGTACKRMRFLWKWLESAVGSWEQIRLINVLSFSYWLSVRSTEQTLLFDKTLSLVTPAPGVLCWHPKPVEFVSEVSVSSKLMGMHSQECVQGLMRNIVLFMSKFHAERNQAGFFCVAWCKS